MAIGDEADVVGSPGADATASAGPAGPPAGPPGGGQPPGGGPLLAALSRMQRGPQVSAPGPGDQAKSQTLILQAVGFIQQALSGLQPGTPLHKDALQAVTRLSRHLNQGQPTAGVQQTSLQDLLRNVMRNAMAQRMIAQQPSQGPPTGQQGPAASPLAAIGQAPMPSTPMPGA